MKKLLIAFGAIVTLSVASLLTLDNSQIAQADTDAVQIAELKQSFLIEKMTCAMCPITVRKVMERVAGVHSVTVDYDAKIAVVVFDPARTSVKAIGDASTDVGYPATPIDE